MVEEMEAQMAADFEEQYGTLEDYLRTDYNKQCYRCILDFENSIYAVNSPVCHLTLGQADEIINLGEFVTKENCMSEDPRTIDNFECLSYIADDIYDCETICA